MTSDVDLDQFHSNNNIALYSANTNAATQCNNHNQAEKRAHHNALERKRRDHIKGSFNNLRAIVPVLKGEKASRAHILKSATEHIHNLKAKTQQNQNIIEDLKRKNAIIELQINILERVKETSLYVKDPEKTKKNRT